MEVSTGNCTCVCIASVMCSPETHRRSRCVGICDAVDCLDQHCCLRSCPGFCGSWHSCVTWKHQEVRSQAPAGLHCSPFTDFHPTSFLSDNPQRCHSTYWNWQRREFLFWNVSDRRAQKNRIILTKSHTGTLVTYSLGIQADVSLCRSTVSHRARQLFDHPLAGILQGIINMDVGSTRPVPPTMRLIWKTKVMWTHSNSHFHISQHYF